MFFQTIYQMMTPGTDLSIHIRKVEDKLSVAVMPRRNSLKEEVQQKMVPLVLSGNPYELDSAFLQAIMQPLQKVQGLLVNAENFEKQAAQAAANGKNGKGSAPAESKEAREKREKMEKLLAKADDAFKNARYQETLTWLRQARALAPGEKQGEIDSRMKKYRKRRMKAACLRECHRKRNRWQPGQASRKMEYNRLLRNLFHSRLPNRLFPLQFITSRNRPSRP